MQLKESESILGKYQSEVDRWDSEVKRLDREVKRGVVDPQILLESTNQFRSSSSARDAARATIDKSRADLLSRQAALAKARVDVDVARADLAVAQSEEKRIAAWVGYITLPAPFDGVVVTRNANTGDFVNPTAGDPTALQRSPNLSPSGMAAPIYTVDRTDIVRIFVDIPEQDANYVRVGTKASVLIQAFRDEPIPGSVTRTSWALNIKSRTLRAEIDLPNTKSELLPGMYAYARVIIERPGVLSLPASALVHGGDKTYCWTYRDGKAARTEIRAGDQRRRLARGHEPEDRGRPGDPGRGRLEAHRRLRKHHHGRPFHPHRRRGGGGRPQGGRGRSDARQGRSGLTAALATGATGTHGRHRREETMDHADNLHESLDAARTSRPEGFGRGSRRPGGSTDGTNRMDAEGRRGPADRLGLLAAGQRAGARLAPGSPGVGRRDRSRAEGYG